MITRNRMKFMAPEGDAGGGTAVLEAPAKAEAPMTPVGDLYTAALAKAQGKEPAPSPAASGPTGPASTGPAPKSEATGATGAASGPTGPAAKEKPATALDSIMDEPGTTGSTSVTGPTQVENEFLKDLPETLPREGRGAHWEKARGVIASQGKTIAERDKALADVTRQLEEAKAAPAGNPAREAELQKQLDDYKDAMVAINVEYDPEHRKKYVDGRAAIVSKAASKLDAFGGKGEAIKEALSMNEGRGRTQAIKEALADLEPVEQNRILQFVSEVERLDDEKAEIMKDPQGAWAKLQQVQNEARTAAAAKAEEFKQKTFEAVSKTLPSKIFLLRSADPSLPGADEHNASVAQMRTDALKLLGPEAKPEDLVEAAYAKQVVPKLQSLLSESRAELKAARAALKEYEGAELGFRGGKAPDKTPEEAKLEKSPGQIFQETLAKSRGE